jgi:hypothetical protein
VKIFMVRFQATLIDRYKVVNRVNSIFNTLKINIQQDTQRDIEPVFQGYF